MSDSTQNLTLNDIADIRTLSSKWDKGEILSVKGKGKFSKLSLRISVYTLWELAKKDPKEIKLIAEKAKKHFYIKEIVNG